MTMSCTGDGGRAAAAAAQEAGQAAEGAAAQAGYRLPRALCVSRGAAGTLGYCPLVLRGVNIALARRPEA